MKKINIGKNILCENDKHAFENALFLTERKNLCLNMISSPGSGKRTTLATTINELRGKMKSGVIEGDIQTDIDAERITGERSARCLNQHRRRMPFVGASDQRCAENVARR